MITIKLKTMFSSRLFLIGLIIKFICLFLFPSFFPREFFIPFIDNAVTHLGENPWSLSPPSLFPYGGVLYTILLIPKLALYWVLGPAALGVGPLSLFVLKLPLLISDIVLFYFLVGFVPERQKSLEKYYWLNPVLFYISYVYGQLDVISITLLVICLVQILKGRILWSAFFMGLAIGSKFHVAICVPLIITFLWNRNYFKDAAVKILKWSIVVITTTFFAFLPVVLAQRGAYVSYGSPEVLRLFAMQIPLSEGMVLYLGIIIVLAVLGRLLISTRITELGLVFGSGLLLSSVVVSSHAASGWFFWSIPFLSLFFTMYLNVPVVVFWFLNILYLATFVFSHYIPADFIFGVSAESVLYSGLQMALIANLIYLWVRCLSREVIVSKRDSSFRFGLSGDSGAGKSVLTKIIQDLYGEGNSSVLEGDNYHKWERGDKNWSQFTHLNPEANQLFHLTDHIRSITLGRPISHALYNHESGKFSTPVEVKPSKTLIVQGLHTFYFKSTRKMFDLKIFLDPDPNLRIAWKIHRDIKLRGSKAESVLTQLEKRASDSQRYINPQIQYADLVLEYFPKDELSWETAISGQNPSILGRWVVWNDVELSPLANQLSSLGFNSNVSVRSDHSDRVQLEVLGEPTADDVELIARKVFHPLRHLTRGTHPPDWHGGVNGISQLVILFLIKKNIEQEVP